MGLGDSFFRNTHHHSKFEILLRNMNTYNNPNRGYNLPHQTLDPNAPMAPVDEDLTEIPISESHTFAAVQNEGSSRANPQDDINRSILAQLNQLNAAMAEMRETNSILSQQNAALNSQIQSIASIATNLSRTPLLDLDPVTTRLNLSIVVLSHTPENHILHQPNTIPP